MFSVYHGLERKSASSFNNNTMFESGNDYSGFGTINSGNGLAPGMAQQIELHDSSVCLMIWELSE